MTSVSFLNSADIIPDFFLVSSLIFSVISSTFFNKFFTSASAACCALATSNSLFSCSSSLTNLKDGIDDFNFVLSTTASGFKTEIIGVIKVGVKSFKINLSSPVT